MFQDHQPISALSCFFDAAKVLRKTRQNNPFPTTSLKNPWFWEKSGISWEKVRRKRKRKLKSKENKKITPLFPQKSLIFSQRWEKSWESWEKCLIKIKKAPPSLSMKKMLLTKAFYCHNGSFSQPEGKPRAALSISGNVVKSLFILSSISLLGDMMSRKYLMMQDALTYLVCFQITVNHIHIAHRQQLTQNPWWRIWVAIAVLEILEYS